jgi:hypothetical protein
MSDFPFNVNQPLTQFFGCFGLDENDTELNYFASFIKTINQKVIVEFGGWLAVRIGKVWAFTQKCAQAISDAPSDIGQALIALITKYIKPPIVELQQFTSDLGKTWLLTKLSGMFADIKTPIPEIDLGLFGIVIPGNQAFYDLGLTDTSETIRTKYAAVIRWVTGWITSMFKWLVGLITNDEKTGILDIILTFLVIPSADTIDQWIADIKDAIVKVGEWIAKRTSPVIDMITTLLATCVKFFVTLASDISKIVPYLTGIITGWITGAVAVDFDSLDTSIHPAIVTIAKFIYCIIKFVVNLLVFMFSFSWVNLNE